MNADERHALAQDVADAVVQRLSAALAATAPIASPEHNGTEATLDSASVQPISRSKQQAADDLGISVSHLETYLASGELPSRRFGRRTVVLRSDLLAFAACDHDGRTGGGGG